MKKPLALALLSSAFMAMAGAASAQVVVLGNGDAAECFRTAKMGNQGSNTAIRTCSRALENPMRRKDEAATYVNRGVLLMRKGEYAKAKDDYERAIALKPELDQAYINYGATLYYLRETEASLKALNTAIEMDTDKMPEALYNRALVYHEKKNYSAAYRDLKRALVLRPDWQPAVSAISRYEVKTRSGT